MFYGLGGICFELFYFILILLKLCNILYLRICNNVFEFCCNFYYFRIFFLLYFEYYKEDEDVSVERVRVIENITIGNFVIVFNLFKVYRFILKKIINYV